MALRWSRRCYATYNPHRVTAASTQRSAGTDVSAYHALYASLGLRHRFDDRVAVQCLTHKSFAHGREGFNEKLAFFGRRILEARVSEFLLGRPTSSETAIAGCDVDGVTGSRVKDASTSERLGHVAMKVEGLVSLLRWKPRNEADRQGSGEVKVAGEALLAIVAALELQAGAREAKDFVDGKIIPGLRVFEAAVPPTHRKEGTTEARI